MAVISLGIPLIFGEPKFSIDLLRYGLGVLTSGEDYVKVVDLNGSHYFIIDQPVDWKLHLVIKGPKGENRMDTRWCILLPKTESEIADYISRKMAK